jgi:hypothetical protein
MATMPAARAAGREAANSPATVLGSSTIGAPCVDPIVTIKGMRHPGEDGKSASIVVVVGLTRSFQRVLDLAPVLAGFGVHYRP